MKSNRIQREYIWLLVGIYHICKICTETLICSTFLNNPRRIWLKYKKFSLNAINNFLDFLVKQTQYSSPKYLFFLNDVIKNIKNTKLVFYNLVTISQPIVDVGQNY